MAAAEADSGPQVGRGPPARPTAGLPWCGIGEPDLTRMAATGTARAIEPPPSRWMFPGEPEALARAAAHGEVVGVGADLEPGTLLAAYRAGVFPMPARRGLMAWWSPDPRGVIPLEPGGLRVSRVTAQVVRAASRSGSIPRSPRSSTPAETGAGRERGSTATSSGPTPGCTELGWVHTVEAWDGEGRLAGGLYGVAIGGFFAGESMFHRQTDASKVALVALVDLLRPPGADCSMSSGRPRT